MLIQRSLFLITLTFLGALFLGLLACGPAAPQDNEPPFTGVTAFPQEDATEEPAEEATETPTATPRPTVCLYEAESEVVEGGDPDKVVEVCIEKPPPGNPAYSGLDGHLASLARKHGNAVMRAEESGDDSTATQIGAELAGVFIWPVDDDGDTKARLKEFLDDSGVTTYSDSTYGDTENLRY